MRILKTKYYGFSDWWNLGVGSGSLKDKLIESMNKSSEEKKNQSVLDAKNSAPTNDEKYKKRDELLGKREAAKKDAQAAEYEKGRIQYELEGGKDPSKFSTENKKLFDQAEHNLNFNNRLYDDLTREADLLESEINSGKDRVVQQKIQQANKAFKEETSRRPNYKKIEEFIQDYENSIKGGGKKNPEAEKLIQKLKRNRNLTRAGVITTGVGTIGAAGYGLYNHFKNRDKKEKN